MEQERLKDMAGILFRAAEGRMRLTTDRLNELGSGVYEAAERIEYLEDSLDRVTRAECIATVRAIADVALNGIPSDA